MPQKRRATKRRPKVDRLGEFPLPGGHYFHPPVVTPRAHTGGWSDIESGALRRLQQLLGVPETGFYDDATADGVRAWKQQRGMEPSLVVDAETWAALRDQ